MMSSEKNFNLNSAAGEFYAEFPALTDRCFFINSSKKTGEEALGNYAEKFSETVLAKKIGSTAYFTLREMLYDQRPCAVLISNSYGPALDMISLPIKEDNPGEFSRELLTTYFTNAALKTRASRKVPAPLVPEEEKYTNGAIWAYHVFDHEAAHAVTAFVNPEIQGEVVKANSYQNECISDVYSLLRHYQRFGTDTGFDEALINSRRRLIPHMQREYGYIHMTSHCLTWLKDNKPEGLDKMSGAQCYEKAVEIVEKAGLTLNQRRFYELFSIAAEGIMAEQGFAAFTTALAAAAKSATPVTLHLAKAYLDCTLALCNLSQEEKDAIAKASNTLNSEDEKTREPLAEVPSVFITLGEMFKTAPPPP